MEHDPDGPADTTMMGIVHDALRRDLRRTRAALSAGPCPQDGRRAAIADHVDWMTRFLRDHHRDEDAGLWPLMRPAQPGRRTAAGRDGRRPCPHHACHQPRRSRCPPLRRHRIRRRQDRAAQLAGPAERGPGSAPAAGRGQ